MHTPVMVDDVLRYLLHKGSRLIVDATLGAAGHTLAILQKNQNVNVIGIDVDDFALRIARRRLHRAGLEGRAELVHGSYTDIAAVLERRGKVDGVLLDLGLSSLQLDDSSRGFSYNADGPIDMRMGAGGKTARELIADSDVKELARILKRFGEVDRATSVARAIKRAESEGRMERSPDLKRAVESVLGRRATPAALSRVYQSLRIAVNRELDNLHTFLNTIPDWVNENSRMVVVSYHSLEDRAVKDFLKRESRSCICAPGVPVCVCGHKRMLEVLTRRVVRPSREEVEKNSRARSARLRAARFVAEE